MKQRLDAAVVARGLLPTRSQAETYIKLGEIEVNGIVIKKPGMFVDELTSITISSSPKYVSRAALKLASVAEVFHLDFRDKNVLDVGSSTGGFTDYSLQHGAKKIVAVEVGSEQLHPLLRGDDRIELHEQTDIRQLRLENTGTGSSAQDVVMRDTPDIVVIDVSFISLREILPHISKLASYETDIIAMVKPQFEVKNENLKHKGVIKNERARRDTMKNFEQWAESNFFIVSKADSTISGRKGNIERFYKLRKRKLK